MNASAIPATMPHLKRPATTRDVAQLAGASPASVSVVLNGAKSNTHVSEATRERILAAARELDYRPNLAARNMASRKSQIVGVLVRNEPHNKLTHPLTWAFMLGINDGLAPSGYSMAMVRLTDVAEDGGLSAPVFQGHLLDGLIVVNQIPAALESKVEELVPSCIWLDANVWREERCIRRDETHAGELAAQKLLEAGYRRWLCLRGSESPEAHFSLHQRMKAIRQVAATADVSLQEATTGGSHRAADESWNEFYALVDSLSPEVGVLAESIYDADRFIKICALRGKRPGLDFGLVCCDEHIGGGLDWPHLSHVSFDRYEMGKMAAGMMLQVLQEPRTFCASQLVRGQWKPGVTLNSFAKEAE